MTPQAKPNKNEPFEYSARVSYADYSVGVEYERLRFSGLLGRYRRGREERAVRRALSELPQGVSVIDSPCGIGRWWPLLATKAQKITAVDISPGMVRHASERASRMATDVSVITGDAEYLPLPDNAADFSFSFALTKHLPRPVQYRVLRELSRVARRGVICTFGVFGHLSYEIWRRRHIPESYPLVAEELDWMASESGLRVDWMVSCTTPVGVERLVRFSKLASPAL